MRTTFFGIEIGRRALQAQRLGLDVTGHNIANANTPGYSRQIARLATTPPYAAPGFSRPTTPGQLGTGVYVAQITRAHDAFIQHQINMESQAKGYWEKRQQILEELELTFLEPTDVGIRNALDQFWQSLQDLSKNPESEAARAVVRERALVLTETVRNTYAQFDPLRKHLDSQIRAGVVRINSLAQQIAALNAEIRKVIVSGDTPNDLFDKRDLLIEELSRLVDVSVSERQTGMIAVTIGGMTLVEGTNFRTIEVHNDPDTSFAKLIWSGSNREVKISSGEMRALIEGRDEEVPYYMEQLNLLVKEIVQGINAIHTDGYGLRTDEDGNPVTGIKFFKDDEDNAAFATEPAANFELSDEILSDPGYIAASSNGRPGDGSNALRMAQFFQEPRLLNGRATPGEFLGAMVAGLGVKSQMAASMLAHQDVLIGHLERLRASVSGVSIDEEMTNLIQYQHAYAAAARLITTVDEAIEMIINRMGLVGR